MRSRLTAVGEAVPVDLDVPASAPDVLPAPPSRHENAIAAGLMLALKTLSQKSVVALASLVEAAMMASVFIVWLLILAAPSLIQLGSAISYAIFILVCLWIRRRGVPQRVSV